MRKELPCWKELKSSMIIDGQSTRGLVGLGASAVRLNKASQGTG